MSTSHRHPFRALFAICFLLIVAAGVIGYAAGWINFKHEDRKTTIEIETNEIKEAAGNAFDSGKELINDTGDQLNELGTESAAPSAPSETSDVDDTTETIPATPQEDSQPQS